MPELKVSALSPKDRYECIYTTNWYLNYLALLTDLKQLAVGL